jgi:uncharacterized delta-60 repeat protein
VATPAENVPVSGMLAVSTATGVASGALIRLTPTSGSPNTSVNVKGKGFGATEQVAVTFDTTQLGTATTDSTGAFSTQVTVPPSASFGTRQVTAMGQTSGLSASAPFLVVAPGGTLDATLDGDGKVTTAIGSSNDSATAVAVQADGKIVVAGYSWNGSNFDFALARYTSTGALDSTFDGDGKVTTPIGSSADFAYSVAVQADGKIVVTGYTGILLGSDFALARYTSSGALDTTFSGDGKLTTNLGAAVNKAYGVAIQATGGSWPPAPQGSSFALARYTTSGRWTPLSPAAGS